MLLQLRWLQPKINRLNKKLNELLRKSRIKKSKKKKSRIKKSENRKREIELSRKLCFKLKKQQEKRNLKRSRLPKRNSFKRNKRRLLSLNKSRNQQLRISNLRMRRQKQKQNKAKVSHQCQQSLQILKKNQRGKEKPLNLNIPILNLRTMSRQQNPCNPKARRQITKGILQNQQEPQRLVRPLPQVKTTLHRGSNNNLSILKYGERQEFNFKTCLTIMEDTNTPVAHV